MQRVFLTLLLVLCGLYAVAELTRSRPSDPGIVYLRWATDPSPGRRDQVKPFEQMNPDIKVVPDPGMGNDQTKLIVQCATGVGPDIIDIDNIAAMGGLVEAGILLDLTPYATQMGFGPESTYPEIRDALLVEGRQYRFPCNVYALSVIYNTQIFRECGVPLPQRGWTWDDLIATGKQIKAHPRAGGSRYIPVANVSSWAFMIELIMEHGSHFYRDHGLRSDLASPGAVAAMQLYYDLLYVHQVIPSKLEAQQYYSQGGWGDGGANWFAGERASMLLLGRWFELLVPSFPEIRGKLGAIPLPQPNRNLPPLSRCDTRAAGINAKSPHRREALKFVQYLASVEYGRTIVDSGEALPPNPALARTGADLVNEIEPDPAFHQAFIDQLHQSRVMDISPFIDPQQVILWLTEKIDHVESKAITPREAMTRLAREVDERIRLNLARRPDLQRKFEAATGKPYQPNWK
jgi:ABC-type glycerol-3-phosphate transport system substrate-binding protein